MTIPRKEWDRFLLRTIERVSDDNTENSKADWTAAHYKLSKLGDYTQNPSVAYWSWKTFVFPSAPDFKLLESLDKVHKFGVEVTIGLYSSTAGVTGFTCFWQAQRYPEDPLPTWGRDTVSGKYRDGANDWDHYPPYMGNAQGDPAYCIPSGLPESFELWMAAYKGGQAESFIDSLELFKNGLVFYWSNYQGVSTPFDTAGHACTGYLIPSRLKVQYFNAVVNSMSRYIVPPAGGVELKLYGVAFDPDPTEWERDWGARVDQIEFIGQQGQGTTTLYWSTDFICNSDNEITITSMPALSYGTYRVKLKKLGVADVGTVESYAGQYRCHISSNPEIDGLVYEGDEFLLFVSDQEPRSPREAKPVILTDWQLKDKLDLSFDKRSYSPVDVCATKKFYDGRLKEVSGLQRAVNDETGLFISSDMSAKLVNVDKNFSKLLAKYYFKNEPVEMFLAFRDYPEAFKTQFFRGFVEDHKLIGGEFDVSLRDLTTVFFQRKVPFYRVTKEEYPNAHDSAIGRAMHELIGKIEYISDEGSGAVEALLVDKTAFKYLAARGSLKAIPQVYNDGGLVSSGYSVLYEDGGRTYIKFDTDQEEAKITFNCEGYIYEAWNSVNGYVQHPVYVFLFYLSLLLGIPVNYIDFASAEKVKKILDDLDPGVSTSGYLALTEEQDAMEVTRELCQTIGGSLFPDRYGRLRLDMKDISNISTSKFIFSGIDTREPPEQDWGLKSAVNRVKASWNYIPGASRYLGSKEKERKEAVDALSGNYQEDIQTLDMKWTTSEALVDKQIFNTLYKRGKGYKRIKIKLPMSFIEYLDIYESFRLQDPYGVSLDGSGDYGRYLYVEKINYDWLGNAMDLETLDLTYILRRYLVLGDEEKLPSNWNATTEESKAFAYLCNETTGKFADGEEGKILVDENKIAM